MQSKISLAKQISLANGEFHCEALGGGTYGNFGKTLGSFQKSNSKRLKHLYGRPGQVKKHGYKETFIGADGRAIKEIHYTDHGNPKWHQNPHEHIIRWNKEEPIFEKTKRSVFDE